MVPLRGYGNIFSHLFQCHHESSISTPFNIYPIHLINVSILVANATIKKENVSKRKKFCYSDGTHFLLLTFSVHFVLLKRILIIHATSLFFYWVILFSFTFFLFFDLSFQIIKKCNRWLFAKGFIASSNFLKKW